MDFVSVYDFISQTSDRLHQATLCHVLNDRDPCMFLQNQITISFRPGIKKRWSDTEGPGGWITVDVYIVNHEW